MYVVLHVDISVLVDILKLYTFLGFRCIAVQVELAKGDRFRTRREREKGRGRGRERVDCCLSYLLHCTSPNQIQRL